MTMALCMNCGEAKFGATCECPSCHDTPKEDDQMNLLFSDWFCSWEQIEEFGLVIKEIGTHSEDPKLCREAFLLYISQKHPQILTYSSDYVVEQGVEDLLKLCDFPKVMQVLVANQQKRASQKGTGNTDDVIIYDDDDLP